MEVRMSNKMDELMRAKGLLTQALSAALNSMPTNKSVQEARMHMKKALNELDNAAKTQTRKRTVSQDQYHQWWNNVVSGVAAGAHSPIAEETRHRSLDQLNKMIEVERQKLDELEKASIKPSNIDELLSD
jgi:hypothetical protein